MADSKAPLTAAERRERRLNRILGDGENRIKKILSGPDGGEQRLPPMLEGGEYKFPLLSNGEEKQEEEETESTPSIPTLSSNRPSPTNQLLSKIRQMDIPLSLLYGHIKFKEPDSHGKPLEAQLFCIHFSSCVYVALSCYGCCVSHHPFLSDHDVRNLLKQRSEPRVWFGDVHFEFM
nr:unnamed protein product [Haemonchus contortus]